MVALSERPRCRCYTAAVTDGRHELAEERSLQLHRAVANRLRADPSLVERARRRVDDWLRDGTVAEPYAEAWRGILAGTVDHVAAPIDEGRRRQISRLIDADFAG